MDVRNTTKGIRGLNTLAGYRDLAPGELATDIELSKAERASAESTGYFEFGKAAASEPTADEPVPSAEPSPVDTPRAADDLDAMSDADLRTTVEALTGKKPGPNTSREKLLEAARATA